MTEKNLNLQQFVTEVRNKIKDEQTLAYFNENISYYDMSLGGCSCSRKTRENYAEDKFIQKINTLPQEILINLKSGAEVK